MQTPVIPSPADIPVGIIVRTDLCIYRGRNSYCAIHRRDVRTTWKTIIQSPGSDTGHEKVLSAWMAKFTGLGSKGFVADYKVVARGGDWNGYYWVLQPTNYN